MSGSLVSGCIFEGGVIMQELWKMNIIFFCIIFLICKTVIKNIFCNKNITEPGLNLLAGGKGLFYFQIHTTLSS